MGSYPRNPIKTARWPTFLIHDPPVEKRCFNLTVNLPFKRRQSPLSVQTQTPSRSIWLRRALQKPWGISSTETLLSAPSSSTSSRWGRPSACSPRSALRRTPNFAQRQSAGRMRLTFLVRESAREIPSRFCCAIFFLSPLLKHRSEICGGCDDVVLRSKFWRFCRAVAFALKVKTIGNAHDLQKR